MPTLLAKRVKTETASITNDTRVMNSDDTDFYHFDRTSDLSSRNMNLSTSGMNAAQNAEVLIKNSNTDWINKKMRPMMGWIYMFTCACDFVLFPILWSLLQAFSSGQVTSQWQPLTLQGAGLYHLAMGAILGVVAYGRTKEKVAGVA